jgi:plastocyanin
MKLKRFPWILVIALACAPVKTEVASAAGGAIEGTIVYEGQPPRMRPLPVESDPECAAMHSPSDPLLSNWMILGDNQSVANMLVQVVAGLPEGVEYPVPQDPVDVTQAGCQYAPRVVGVRAGQPIRFLNPDGLQHNVHVMPKVNREFNMSMARTRTEVTHVFDKPEPIFRIKCDVHNWMESFCAVFDHPFFDVTEEDGKFRIDGLPAGDYEIEAWHERLGTQRVKVTVRDGETATVDFTFKRPGT